MRRPTDRIHQFVYSPVKVTLHQQRWPLVEAGDCSCVMVMLSESVSYTEDSRLGSMSATYILTLNILILTLASGARPWSVARQAAAAF